MLSDQKNMLRFSWPRLQPIFSPGFSGPRDRRFVEKATQQSPIALKGQSCSTEVAKAQGNTKFGKCQRGIPT
jgi:hypothetical protein